MGRTFLSLVVMLLICIISRQDVKDFPSVHLATIRFDS